MTTPATTLPLLLEIGCEEIPARFLAQAQKDFGEKLQAALQNYHLLPPCSGGVPTADGKESATRTSPLQTHSTPRRLVAYVPKILAKQPDKVKEVMGPPVKVAFDAGGKPTRAAQSFAEKNQARVEDLVQVTTPKGEYLALKKTTPGRPAREILPEILPETILGLSFPKSMYWTGMPPPLPTPTGWGVFLRRFVRPIRWIVAILGEGKQAATLDFQILDVKSGNFTFGHRASGQQPIPVSGLKDYVEKLRAAQVELDPEKRRESIRQKIKVLLEESRLKVIQDQDLEDWIVNSTEWPHALLGSFDDRFLKLPREILITVMRDHQKYFAVEDEKENLQPRFVTVLNRDGDPKGLIRAGHERVLVARFRDAEFFWDADLKVLLEQRLNLLAGVTYQAELGSYAEKINRMKKVAEELCRQLEAHSKPGSSQEWREVDTQRALFAVGLSKVDLTTRMVQEFPELQGIIGGLYARAQRLGEEVSTAIYDHYLPKGLEDRSPKTLMAAVVSLADKIDSVVSGFAVGLEPTGSSDPFGLRRQGNGIIKVLDEFSIPVNPMGPLFERAVEGVLQSGLRIPQGIPALETKCTEFFEERLAFFLQSAKGLRYDTVRAALAPGLASKGPLGLSRCAEALEKIRGSDDMEALCVAAKRIKNILTKSATGHDWKPGDDKVVIVQEGAEKDLYMAYVEAAAQMDSLVESGDYEKALSLVAGLRPSVDRFFDKVLVMAEDPALRENRLRLLGKLDELFSGIADLSQIKSTTLDVVDASTSRAGEPSALSRQPSANAAGKRSS